MKKRFDPNDLDPEDPFEIDSGNRPHLYKHLPTGSGHYVAVGEEELLDLYIADDPLFYPGRDEDPADWLMVGEVPELVLVVPLAPPNAPDARKCRPISIFSAGEAQRSTYRRDAGHV